MQEPQKVFWDGSWHIKDSDGTIGPECDRPSDEEERERAEKAAAATAAKRVAALASPTLDHASDGPARVDAGTIIDLNNILAIVLLVLGALGAWGSLGKDGGLAAATTIVLVAVLAFAALKSTSVALRLLSEIRDVQAGTPSPGTQEDFNKK